MPITIFSGRLVNSLDQLRLYAQLTVVFLVEWESLIYLIERCFPYSQRSTTKQKPTLLLFLTVAILEEELETALKMGAQEAWHLWLM
jgi:hypothetical protein